jgi:hypothetical protein
MDTEKEPLEKGLPKAAGAAAALLMSGGFGAAHMQHAAPKEATTHASSPAQTTSSPEPVAHPSNHLMQEVGKGAGAGAVNDKHLHTLWHSPDGSEGNQPDLWIEMNPDLHHLAFQESHWGKNVNHYPDSRGPFYTAQGTVGLRPFTAKEVYNKTKALQQEYPHVADDDLKFTEKMRNDHAFYNKLANTTWDRIGKFFPDDARKAFAWRHGANHHGLQDPKTVANDAYVQWFLHLKHGGKEGDFKYKPVGMSKAEDATQPLTKFDDFSPDALSDSSDLSDDRTVEEMLAEMGANMDPHNDGNGGPIRVIGDLIADHLEAQRHHHTLGEFLQSCPDDAQRHYNQCAQHTMIIRRLLDHADENHGGVGHALLAEQLLSPAHTERHERFSNDSPSHRGNHHLDAMVTPDGSEYGTTCAHCMDALSKE